MTLLQPILSLTLCPLQLEISNSYNAMMCLSVCLQFSPTTDLTKIIINTKLSNTFRLEKIAIRYFFYREIFFTQDENNDQLLCPLLILHKMPRKQNLLENHHHLQRVVKTSLLLNHVPPPLRTQKPGVSQCQNPENWRLQQIQ